MAFTKAANMEDIWNGEMISCDISGTKVVLIRIDDSVYAYEDRCAHLALPLSEGSLSEDRLICAGHHWEYDPCTGKGINPKSACLTSFAVKIEERQILVDIEQITNRAERWKKAINEQTS
jgi:nitrite reductase/ring-hydroxylating ferredoxin subunit